MGQGNTADSAIDAIDASYKEDVTDEFYTNQNGIVKTSKFERYTASVSLAGRNISFCQSVLAFPNLL